MATIKPGPGKWKIGDEQQQLMGILHILFWVSLAILFYCYIGYGVILFLLNKIRAGFRKEKKDKGAGEVEAITLIIAAYNESEILEEKINNIQKIIYPANKLELIFVTDGSTDGSEGLVKKYPFIRLLHEPERRGKYAAIKRAMREVKTPLVVFSDANTMLNEECLQRIALHYSDPKVGGVAGEKKIIKELSLSPMGEAEGLYWQYESFLKKLDASFNTVTGAAGELFSIRTRLFTELDDNLILDDFVISMQICLQGYKIAYEPGAFAKELPSATIAEEAKRKIRISAGAYQSIGYLKKCLNVFKHPLLTFQYVSRRLLRWTLCPFLLGGIAIINILIVVEEPVLKFYFVLLGAQVLFYILAFIGWLLVRKKRRAGVLTIPFYFVFMNYCLVKGFLKFLRGKQTVLWEKSLREKTITTLRSSGQAP